MSLFTQPAGDIPLFGTEFHADFHDFTTVTLVRDQATFIVYLLQGFLCDSTKFELKDIDVLGSLYHRVGTPSGATDLCAGILPHQFEHQIKKH